MLAPGGAWLGVERLNNVQRKDRFVKPVYLDYLTNGRFCDEIGSIKSQGAKEGPRESSNDDLGGFFEKF